MAINLIILIASLGFILFSCYLFTNAVECLGDHFNLGQGFVGSILSAIGTALPETIIPIIAIVYYNDKKALEIGVGAIAGAPFMLATLAFFITGIAVVIFTLLKRRTLKMSVNTTVFKRDLVFFIFLYGSAVLTTFFNKIPNIRIIVVCILIGSYFLYLISTIKNKTEAIAETDPLIFSKFFKGKESFLLINFQLIISLAFIVLGAHTFVNNVEQVSDTFNISPLILSLIITPIATELPEKLNSVLWIRRKKDTLALGNITGAMVFQSCFPVTVGLLFTSWNLNTITLLSAFLALASAIINLLYVKITDEVSPFVLMTGGLMYSLFLLYILA
ncbi:MAG: sodium:calcium antiporter [Clostridiaceae bacterium]